MNKQDAIKSLKNIVEYWTYRPTEVEAAKIAISALEQQLADRWIPCSERFPENETEVEVTIERHYEGKIRTFTCRAIHYDGTMHMEDSGYCWEEHDFEYCEEIDDYIIPEGWYEQNRYCDVFGIVDDFVIAWRSLPQPYKEDAYVLHKE